MRPENEVHNHVSSELPELFSSDGDGATEVEYLELLGSLIRALKPNSILETGTASGAGTIMIAAALQHNGFGHVTTIEAEAHTYLSAIKRFEMYRSVKVVHARSLEYLVKTDVHFDLGFFDSQLPIRADEVKVCLDRGLMVRGATIVVHDTSRVRTRCDGLSDVPDPDSAVFWEKMDALRSRFDSWFEFPLSRGMLVARVC